MNRTAVLLFAAALVIAAYAIVAFAQPGMTGGGGGQGVGTLGEQGIDPLEAGMGVRRARTGPPWMSRAVISASGNNVFIVTGDLLLKYDQDLNLVRQTELPDPEMELGRGRARGGTRGGRGMGGARNR